MCDIGFAVRQMDWCLRPFTLEIAGPPIHHSHQDH